MNTEDIYADCIICDYFQLIEKKQKSYKFDLTGQPNRFVNGISKKMSSSFSSKLNEFIKPIIKIMNERKKQIL